MHSDFPPRSTAAEPRTLELSFGEFGWDALTAAAGASGAVSAFVEAACAAFGTRLYGSDISLQAPGFSSEDETTRAVVVAASKRLWADLQMEAGRQGITLERLVEHAAFLHLAARYGAAREAVPGPAQFAHPV